MEDLQHLLNEEDCITVLKNYTNNEKFEFKSHLITRLESINGLVGEHFRLRITYLEAGEEKAADFFLKALNASSKVIADLTKSIQAYEKEEFFYNYLLKESDNKSLHRNIAPKCYLCRPTLYVLEDLSLRDYQIADNKNMLDAKHCKVALKTLAKFHANSILLEDINSKFLYEEFPQYLQDVFLSETRNLAQDWLECTVKGVLGLIDLLPESDISPDEFKAKIFELLEGIKNSQDSADNMRCGVLHGDLWSNNFLFKYENGRPVDSILIDYQTLKYGPLAEDVVHTVITNVRRSVREVHYEELLSYYYHQFVEACGINGVDGAEFLKYNEFMESCDQLKVAVKLHCILDHSITLLMNEEIADVFHSEELLREFLFGDRSTSMARSYNKDDVYREIMTEDLIELRDMLFKS